MVRLPGPAKWALRVIAIGYVFLLVGWPMITLVQNAFADGLGNFQAAFSDPDVVHAMIVTIEISFWAVAINTVFGVGMALLLVRYEFPGQAGAVGADRPAAGGLAGRRRPRPGAGLQRPRRLVRPDARGAGIQVIFATPGMIMATCFVSLPLVVREVVPVLEEIGDDQEQAARSLGASAFQTFRRITLPAIKWAVVYGVVLTLARSLGEFGAVKIVSGNLTGQTQTASLAVEQEYQNFAQGEAYAISFVLVLLAVLCIVVVSLLRPKEAAS